MPTLKADLSEEGDADLWLPTTSVTGALEMRNGVKCPQNRSKSDLRLRPKGRRPILHLFSFQTPININKMI